MSEITAYPLAWPIGWRRTSPERRAYGRFNKKVTKRYSYGDNTYQMSQNLSVHDAVSRLLQTFERMGIDTRDDVVISTNLVLRLDGLPRSGQSMPSDPGACAYWVTSNGDRRCMAIDRYTKVEDNIAAIAATLEAMRAIERHGGAEILDRAFTGFQALPNPEQWWHVLGLETADVTEEEITRTWRTLAQRNHPDRGGNDHHMGKINRARDEGLRQIGRDR